MKLLKDMTGAEVEAHRQSIRKAIIPLMPPDVSYVIAYLEDGGEYTQLISNVHESELVKFMEDQTENCYDHLHDIEIQKDKERN